MKIKTQKGFIEPYDMQRIVESLESDVDFAKTQGVLTDLDGSHIRRIAKRVTTKLDKMLYEDDDVISSDTIRGLTVSELMADGEDQVANVVGLVGLHPKRIFEIINGAADNDNANLQHNPETTHKIIADEVSKKYYLGQLPRNLSHLHLSGDLHIHDLEYFGTRLFCQDWDLRYFFYYGLMPDGEGTRASVSGPAKNPEVAILHAVKALSAAQTNFAGGQGFYNFLTFLAPYLEGLSYPEIYQLMQMFVYEMTQMMVARGGQVVFSSVQLTPGVPLLWRDKPAVFKGKVWSDRTYGEFEREVRLAFKALMEVMIAGDYWGKPFNFPKPEIAIEPEFIDESTWTDELIVDDEIIPSYKDLYGLAFELTAKFGTPYFDNMIPAYRGHSKGGVACYQCSIHPDSLMQIVTHNGIKLQRIKDVNLDDVVNTPFGPAKFEDMLIHENKDNGYLNEVILAGGRRLLMTNDHKMPVGSLGTLKRGDELQKGDELIIDCTLPCDHDLPVYSGALVDGREYDLKLSYLLGLFAAEGSSARSDTTKERHLYWCFGSHEIDLIEKTKSYIKDVFGYDAKEYLQNEGKGLEVAIHRYDIYKWFEDNGIALKGYEMTVPPFIFTAPKEYKWAFLQGYYRGDGTLRRNGKKSKIRRIEINTISEKLAEGVLLLTGSLGYNFQYTISQDNRPGRKTRYILTLNKRQDIHDFFGGVFSDPTFKLKVRLIHCVPYTGLVYDPINVKGHLFITGQGIVSSNCAYNFQVDPLTDPDFESKMQFKNGAHFSMGSSQVVTLNVPRAAYYASEGLTTESRTLIFINRLKSLMAEACKVFKFKKSLLEPLIAGGRVPFATQRPKDPATREAGTPAADLDAMVWTIGIVGMNEAIEAICGKQLHEDDHAVDIARRVMTELKLYCYELTAEYGFKIALARTPAETVAQRFAVLDLTDDAYHDQAIRVVKGDVTAAIDQFCSGSRDLPIYYTNGCMLPSDCDNIYQRLTTESKFFPLVDGGDIFHVWLGEANTDPGALMDFAMRVATKTDIGYFAFTKDLTVCRDCGTTGCGLYDSCCRCKSPNVDYVSRITGYMSSVSGWNAAKRQELEDRRRVSI